LRFGRPNPAPLLAPSFNEAPPSVGLLEGLWWRFSEGRFRNLHSPQQMEKTMNNPFSVVRTASRAERIVPSNSGESAVATAQTILHGPPNYQLSLFSAQIVLGSGVFALPSEAARCGLIPLVLGLVGVNFFAAKMYNRVAAAAGGIQGGVAS
jgi:hypothetical protein